MHLYAIANDDLSLVKFGSSEDVPRRLAALQAGSGAKLRVLKVWTGFGESERLVHDIFREERVHGEWFRNTGHVKSFINSTSIGEAVTGSTSNKRCLIDGRIRYMASMLEINGPLPEGEICAASLSEILGVTASTIAPAMKKLGVRRRYRGVKGSGGRFFYVSSDIAKALSGVAA